MSSVKATAVLGEAARIYGRHAAVVVGASILVQTVGVMATFLVLNNSGMLMASFLVGVIGLVTTQLTIGTYTVLLMHVRGGSSVPSISDLITQTLPRLLPLLGLAIATSFCVGFGMLFLLVPGIYLLLRWAVAAPALVAGPLAIGQAMSSSANLTKQAMGSTFVIVLFQVAVSIGIPLLSEHMAGAAQENVFLANAAVSALIAPLPALAVAELFLRLAGYAPGADGIAFRPGAPTAGPEHRVHVPLAPAPAPAMPLPAAQAWAATPAQAAAPTWPPAQPSPALQESIYNPNYQASPSGGHTIDCDPPPQPASGTWTSAADGAPPRPHGQPQPGQPHPRQADGYGQPHAQPAPGLSAPVTNPLAKPGAAAPYGAAAAPNPYAAPAPRPPVRHAQPHAAPPHAPPTDGPGPPARTHSVAPPGMG